MAILCTYMRLCWLYIGRICVYMVYILLGKCSYMHVVHEYVIRDILIVPLTHHFTCSPSLGSLPTSLPVHHHWVHYPPPYLFTITGFITYLPTCSPSQYTIHQFPHTNLHPPLTVIHHAANKYL